MKILHLASFSGNIGDNASHMGLRKILSELLNFNQIENIEIRDFYKSTSKKYKKYFDETFVDLCNNYDLVIWGGGGYLDYWVPDSKTGSTFDISNDIMDKIIPPTVITSVGCVPGNKVPNGNKEKFNNFLKYISHSKKFHLLLRNDGSYEHVKENFGNDLAINFSTILDNAFHYEHKKNGIFPAVRDYVAFCIADDQIIMDGEGATKFSKDKYYREISAVVNYLIKVHKLDVCFVPHRAYDIKSINHILNNLDDKYIRNNILVAPYMVGDNGANYLFGIYKNSILTIGDRFHSNVCGVSLGIKTIGLSALSRVRFMYDSIGLKDSYLEIEENFSTNLIQKIDILLNTDLEDYKKKYFNKLNNLRNESINKYKNIFSLYF